MITMPDTERAALFDRLRTYLRETPETATGEFALPLVTMTARAVLG